MSQEQGQQRGEAIETAARLLVESTHVVALVGAGISVESGIPPYRGPGGLWTRFGEPDMKGYQRFLEDPAAWWKEQLGPQQGGSRAEFREAIEKASPNAGHYALADLEQMNLLKFTITQNVDNLHQVAGSKRLAEIHGNRTKLRCIECNFRTPRAEFEVKESPPRCPECGGVIKGDTVMFGEPIPSDVLQVCFEQTSLCDCMMLIGTSATVYPAAGFPSEVKSRGAYLIEINPYPTPFSDSSDVVLREPSGEVLPQLVGRVKELKNLAKRR